MSYSAYTLKQSLVWRLLGSCGELLDTRSVRYDAGIYEFKLLVMS